MPRTDRRGRVGYAAFRYMALLGGLRFIALIPSITPAAGAPGCSSCWCVAGLLTTGGTSRKPIREGRPNVELMVPICNLLAYVLGPEQARRATPWMAIGVTVVAVLLLTARERLHGVARRVEIGEIITAGKFLILTGLVHPFLPDKPIGGFTEVTPHQVWLAVIAVSTVSYASYLLRRYGAPPGAGLWIAVLGGLYSSTVTTVVLARRVW